MNLIIIPVFNDWRSLNKLLFKINENLNINSLTRILVIDDCSSIKKNNEKKKLKKIKNIQVLRLNKNVGSQKAIAIALHYLNIQKIRDFDYVTIMDGDGEDNPSDIKQMINEAKNQKDSIIVSCRRGRSEGFFIQLCYKIHLVLTFFLTGHWITFGNFSCFFHKNIKKILSDNSIWHAFSSAVAKNVKIKRVYARRAKRFYGKTKVNFLFFLGHSIRIIGVFYKRVLMFSVIYSFLISIFFEKYASILYATVFLGNILILWVMSKNHLKNNNFIKFIENKKRI